MIDTVRFLSQSEALFEWTLRTENRNTVLHISAHKKLLTQKLRSRGLHQGSDNQGRAIILASLERWRHTLETREPVSGKISWDLMMWHETEARPSASDQHLVEIRVFVNLSAPCLITQHSVCLSVLLFLRILRDDDILKLSFISVKKTLKVLWVHKDIVFSILQAKYIQEFNFRNKTQRWEELRDACELSIKMW